MPIILCTPQYRSSSRAKVANTASGEEEPSDAVCEIASVSLKSDMCKHFGFSVSGDRHEKNNAQTAPDCN